MSRRFAAPLRAVDHVENASAGYVEVVKEVDPAAPYLAGHYPDFVIYPGVFTIETVYQATRRATEEQRGPGVRAELAGVPSARFSAPLLAADVLRARCTEVETGQPDLVRWKALCQRSDGTQAAQVVLDLRLTRRPDA